MVGGLVTIVVLISLAAIFRRPQHLSDTEQAALLRLDIYKPKVDFDKKGRIVRIGLEGKRVTDEALEEMTHFPHLRRLSLLNTSITDAGLKHLQNSKRLEALNIMYTNVTNNGLRHLEKIPSLQNVWLRQTDKLTSKGMSALRRALPGLRVHVAK